MLACLHAWLRACRLLACSLVCVPVPAFLRLCVRGGVDANTWLLACLHAFLLVRLPACLRADLVPCSHNCAFLARLRACLPACLHACACLPICVRVCVNACTLAHLLACLRACMHACLRLVASLLACLRIAIFIYLFITCLLAFLIACLDAVEAETFAAPCSCRPVVGLVI